MMPDTRTESVPLNPPINSPNDSPTLPIDATPDEWHSWSETALYDVESIVGAEPSGRGWKVRVKWLGHPTITTERLSSITSRVTDPKILGEIEIRKAEYLAKYPSTPPGAVVSSPTVPPSTPTRTQPNRSSRASTVFLLIPDGDDNEMIRYACTTLRADSSKRVQSLHQLGDVR